MLGELIASPAPLRLADVGAHPQFLRLTRGVSSDADEDIAVFRARGIQGLLEARAHRL